jgi:aspartate kinase
MRVVMKFGGVSVADGDKFRRAGLIVETFHKRGDQIVVVTSAMYSVTNSLVKIASEASKGMKDEVRKFVEDLAERHMTAAKAAVKNPEMLDATMKRLETTCDDLRNILLGVAHVGELTPRSKDLVVGFGERMAAPILQGVLEDLGVRAKALSGGEAGIVTDDNFGSAQPLMNVTSLQVRQVLGPIMDEGITPVVSGAVRTTPRRS